MSELIYVPEKELRRIRRLKGPRDARTQLFADVCRLNTLYMIAAAGSGHIGSSFSSLDIVVHLFLNEMSGVGRSKSESPRDIYFSSKGHDAPGFYAVLIGLGQLDFQLLHQLRRLGGLPGHPDVAVPGVEVNTGSLGMGISKAKGIALANRHLGREGRIFVLTGDGELQEGQFWESLASAATQQLAELTVIVDHNKLQSDTFISDVADLGDLDGKLRSFGWHVERCDGHDPADLTKALAAIRGAADRPGIVIADTVKGRGVSFMEHTQLKRGDLYAFHSGAPSEAEYDKAAQELVALVNRQLEELQTQGLEVQVRPRQRRTLSDKPQRLIEAYACALVDEGSRDERIVVLDADLVLDCGLIPFRKAFPGRFYELGIAEQDMVSVASGMAQRGLLPIVHSFACFLSARANEQIYNAATERSRILYVGSLAGLLPAGPGHSHQAVRDISSLGAIPDLILLEPATEAEVVRALRFALHKAETSVYLRLASLPCSVPFELRDEPLELGRGESIRDGADALVIGYGPVLLSQAWAAAELLDRNHGIRVRLVNLPWLNRLDIQWLSAVIRPFGEVFSLDDHYVIGGQGDRIAQVIAGSASGRVRLTRLGVDRLPECGTDEEVLRAHRLDAASLAERIRSKLSQR